MNGKTDGGKTQQNKTMDAAQAHTHTSYKIVISAVKKRREKSTQENGLGAGAIAAAAVKFPLNFRIQQSNNF